MICENCKRKIVLHAFSFGKCDKCDCDVTTSHIPCDKLCVNCSDEFKLCKGCGCAITEDNK